MFVIEEELKKLPGKPGVYIMHDDHDNIIYVGKAISLKNRVRQYFQSSRNHTEKIKQMVSHVSYFEYIITDSELEALVLENNLIKEHKPKYNTMLKDDKTYPYIKVTVNEDFPRVLFSRELKKDKAKYFGPYTSAGSVKDTIELLRKLYKIRTCSRMQSAQREFLDKGYEKASLRSIAQNAGVTTGALYVRFPNKSALFAALVEPVSAHLLGLFRTGNDQGFEQLDEGRPEDMWSTSEDVITRIVDYIFEHKEPFDLLINHAAGSGYEHFLDDLVEEEVSQSLAYLDAMRERGLACASPSHDDLHALVSAEYYAFFEIVRHDTSKEDAVARIKLIVDFFRPGWENLFGG